MSKPAQNPVVSEEVAEKIVTTFISAVPKHMPISMQGPQDLAKSKVNLDDNKVLDESSRNKIRISLNDRESKLLRRLAEGGFLDFGQVVTNNIVVTTKGLQAQLSNYKKQTIKMNINKFTLNIMSDLLKAQIIADSEGKSLYLHTSAYGSYPNIEWFDTIYVIVK